jgi:hypothetical protein
MLPFWSEVIGYKFGYDAKGLPGNLSMAVFFSGIAKIKKTKQDAMNAGMTPNKKGFTALM